MDVRKPLCTLAATILLSVGTGGCVEKMLLEGQIEATRKAADAANTLSDYEVARGVAFSGIGQFEGMHYLAPDNRDALFSLTQTWASVAFGYIQDEMEEAEDAAGTESALYLYH